jgi:hyperosmotically inducible protein
MRRTVKVALLAAAVVAASAVASVARADDVKHAVKKDAKDAWLDMKVKYHLITADNVPAGPIDIDTNNGVVTLRGKVETEAEKAKAEEVARRVDGVKEVHNLLQVVPRSRKEDVKATDKEVKDRVEHTLKADKRFDDIHVKSVDNGVVVLSGKATMAGALRAAETVRAIPGVRHVASEIEISDRS